jgi:hypothetical protein
MIEEKRSLWLPALGLILVLVAAIVAYDVFFGSRAEGMIDQAGLPPEKPLQTSTPEPTSTPRATLTPLPTPSPAPTSTAIPNAVDDTAYGITYADMVGVRDPEASGGGYRTTRTARQQISYVTLVSTTSISLLTYRGPDQGVAQVTIDGIKQDPLDLYSAMPEYDVVQEYSGLVAASHRIVVRARGTKNPASSGTEVRVDGFRFGDGMAEDDDLEVRYGSWLGVADSNAYGGSYRRSDTADATLSFGFTGTQFAWITAQCPRCGQAQVIVDGTVIKTVDLYSASENWQHAEVFDGFSLGEHTVIIRVLGTKNANSRDAWIIFDAFGVPQ